MAATKADRDPTAWICWEPLVIPPSTGRVELVVSVSFLGKSGLSSFLLSLSEFDFGHEH
jgi:hypothetical protein